MRLWLLRSLALKANNLISVLSFDSREARGKDTPTIRLLMSVANSHPPSDVSFLSSPSHRGGPKERKVLTSDGWLEASVGGFRPEAGRGFGLW
jgi:hypothetical protein